MGCKKRRVWKIKRSGKAETALSMHLAPVISTACSRSTESFRWVSSWRMKKAQGGGEGYSLSSFSNLPGTESNIPISVDREKQASLQKSILESFSKVFWLHEWHLDRKHLQGFPCGSDGKESAWNVGDCLQCSIPELGKPLEKGMATYSSILAWRTPWTEDPGRLQSMGSPSTGHDWVTNTHTGRTDSQTFGRRTQRHEVMTKSLVFPSPYWVGYCLNSAGIRQVIQGSKYGHCSRVERTVASWDAPALQKCQSPFDISPVFGHHSRKVQYGHIFWFSREVEL